MKRTPVLIALLPLLLAAGCNQSTNPPDSALDAPTPAEPDFTPPDRETAPPASGDGTDVTLPAGTLPTDGSVVNVVMRPTENNAVTGELTLTPIDDGIRISGTLQGVEPNSEHGFHIHETGDCSAPDASSAGGHFAPQGNTHGHPGTPDSHAGDMPNQRADDQGNIEVDVNLQGAEYGTGGPTDIGGRALVLHAEPDDYTSQPSGESGGRIACGVIPPASA